MLTSRHAALFLAFFLIFQACKSQEEFTGFSYDPEDVTETTTKQINLQHRHAIGISSDGVWVSNEFEGARITNFYQANDTLYQAIIEPERSPINNSPWYAFKAWAERDTTVWMKLSYPHGSHRYRPKISKNGENWNPVDGKNYRLSKTDSSAFVRLQLQAQPLWVSAQELRTQSWFNQWADSIATQPFISRDTVGYSHQQRPVQRLIISEVPDDEKRGVVIITGRLHPPEVTGNMACLTFLEEIASNSELAQNFRQHFEIIAYPFANPDGVENGHWRYNAGGVDLNRDWQNFNQPETQAIRDDLLALLDKNEQARVYYGIDFHSTSENIFYPINRDIETFPDDFTYDWLKILTREFRNTKFTIEPFDTSSPITKNWIYHTFGADALTYEVDDRADRQKLREVSSRSAQIIMQQLLEKFNQ